MSYSKRIAGTDMNTTNQLTEEQAASLDLPAGAKTALRTVGVPADLRLLGWQGPTLFTSEIQDRPLRELGDGYVIGSVRETVGDNEPYSFFACTAAQARSSS
jgi:hypothetical protein